MDLSNSKDAILVLHQRLEPIERAEVLKDALEKQYPSARNASVLIALFDENNETYLSFIRRASTLRAHSGEIAFPGGGVEPTDSSMVMAALREAEEACRAPSR